MDDDKTQSDNNIQKEKFFQKMLRLRGEMQLTNKVFNNNVKTKAQRINTILDMNT